MSIVCSEPAIDPMVHIVVVDAHHRTIVWEDRIRWSEWAKPSMAEAVRIWQTFCEINFFVMCDA